MTSIIAYLGLFFSCILIVQAFNTGRIYDALIGGKPINIQTKLGKRVMRIDQTIQADKAVREQEYKKALELLSASTSQEYYNRGTIQMLLAYQNALGSSISGLQNAQMFVAQALQSFDIAKKLPRSKKITRAISSNERTVSSLSTLVDIKTCYGIGQKIIMDSKDIIIIIKNIKNILDQEDLYIQKNISNLTTVCYEKLNNIIDTSREQVALLQGQMQKNTNKYISDLSKKLEDPLRCREAPYEDILFSMTKGKKGLQEYQGQHIASIEALKSNDPQRIQELCEQSKNDAQINQEIEAAVQELLQKLEDNKIENQEQKKSTKEAKYKDFLDENEKKTLEEIQTTNQGWINTLLEIRGKGNYTPEKYINKMFDQFYGNPGDFINLHKKK